MAAPQQPAPYQVFLHRFFSPQVQQHWSDDTPPAVIGMLDPWEDWRMIPKPLVRKDAQGNDVHRNGVPVRDFSFLPTNLPAFSKLPPWAAEAYFRGHRDFEYDDLRAREPPSSAWLSDPGMSNKKARLCRRPLNARCWVVKVRGVPRTRVEWVETLSPEQIRLNTTWIVLPNGGGIQQPGNPNRILPRNFFLYYGQEHRPSRDVQEALMKLQEVRSLATQRGLTSWRALPPDLLPGYTRVSKQKLAGVAANTPVFSGPTNPGTIAFPQTLQTPGSMTSLPLQPPIGQAMLLQLGVPVVLTAFPENAEEAEGDEDDAIGEDESLDAAIWASNIKKNETPNLASQELGGLRGEELRELLNEWALGAKRSSNEIGRPLLAVNEQPDLMGNNFDDLFGDMEEGEEEELANQSASSQHTLPEVPKVSRHSRAPLQSRPEIQRALEQGLNRKRRSSFDSETLVAEHKTSATHVSNGKAEPKKRRLLGSGQAENLTIDQQGVKPSTAQKARATINQNSSMAWPSAATAPGPARTSGRGGSSRGVNGRGTFAVYRDPPSVAPLARERDEFDVLIPSANDPSGFTTFRSPFAPPPRVRQGSENERTDSSTALNSESSSRGQFDLAYASLHSWPGTQEAEGSHTNPNAGSEHISSGSSVAAVPSADHQSAGSALPIAANSAGHAGDAPQNMGNTLDSTSQLPVSRQLADLNCEDDDADFTTEPQILDWANATYDENGVLVDQYPPPILPAPAPGFSRAGVRWALKSRCHRVYQAKEGRREKWSCLRLYCTSCPRFPTDEDFVDEYGPHYDEIPRIDPLWLKPTAQSQQARIYRREVGLDYW